MKTKILSMTVILLLSPFVANAIPCSITGGIIPDGRIGPLRFIDNTADQSMFTRVVAGHSYSLEVASQFSTFLNNSFTATFNTGGCNFVNGVGFVDTTNASPSTLNENQDIARAIYIAPANMYIYTTVHMISGTATDYTLTVTDTTLYNPRWSTNQGYITVYGFQNTTTQTVHGTLTANATFGGSDTVTYSLNGGAGIAPGDQLLVALGPGQTINVPADEAGSATLAHDGPPGTLMVDAYFANSVSLVPAVLHPEILNTDWYRIERKAVNPAFLFLPLVTLVSNPGTLH